MNDTAMEQSVSEETEQPISLRDELANNLANIQSEGSEQGNDDVREPQGTEDDTHEAEEGIVNEEEDISQGAETEQNVLEIPEDLKSTYDYLSKEDRELLDQQDPEVVELVLRREKERAGVLTRKTQGIGDAIRLEESVKELFEPINGFLKSNGITYEQYIGKLINQEKMISTDPKTAIQNIAKAHGLDLENLNAESTGYVDPLQEKVETLEKKLAERDQQDVASVNNEVNTHIADFKNQKDENGNLLHPHFDDIAPTMGKLIAEGKADDLESAYKIVSDRMGLGIQKEEQPKPKAKRKSIKEARKAGTGVNSSGTSNPTETGGSLRDELTRNMKKQGYFK